MRIAVTGTAGFIGNEVALRLLQRGDQVLGIDALQPYDTLKEARLSRVTGHSHFIEKRVSIQSLEAMRIINNFQPEMIVHLAAQVGVRLSIEHPIPYGQTNLIGFLNILEAARMSKSLKHFLFASSSSVYGTMKPPFDTTMPTSTPMNLYAATKMANELMAHSYSHLYDIPCTALRFFSVYGPWGRPDMAIFKWTQALMNGRDIELFREGLYKRDFTYIDDTVTRLIKYLDNPPSMYAPLFDRYDIGNSRSVEMGCVLLMLEELTGRKAKIGSVIPIRHDADMAVSLAAPLPSGTPQTSLEEGLKKFVEWYLNFYHK